MALLKNDVKSRIGLFNTSSNITDRILVTNNRLVSGIVEISDAKTQSEILHFGFLMLLILGKFNEYISDQIFVKLFYVKCYISGIFMIS